MQKNMVQVQEGSSGVGLGIIDAAIVTMKAAVAELSPANVEAWRKEFQSFIDHAEQRSELFIQMTGFDPPGRKVITGMLPAALLKSRPQLKAKPGAELQ